MSWEVVQSTRTACSCGAGEVERIWEMDDWNRSRTKTVIHCAHCARANDALHAKRREQEAKMRVLHNRARTLAEERYLARWLDLYAGLTKKAAWERYRGAKSYPALGTFYIHVNDAGGLENYLRDAFRRDFAEVLESMHVKDDDIAALLAAYAEMAAALPSPIPAMIQD